MAFGASRLVSYGTLASFSNDNLWGAHATYDWNFYRHAAD